MALALERSRGVTSLWGKMCIRDRKKTEKKPEAPKAEEKPAQKQEYEDKLEGLVLFDPMPFDGIENIDDLTPVSYTHLVAGGFDS